MNTFLSILKFCTPCCKKDDEQPTNANNVNVNINMEGINRPSLKEPINSIEEDIEKHYFQKKHIKQEIDVKNGGEDNCNNFEPYTHLHDSKKYIKGNDIDKESKHYFSPKKKHNDSYEKHFHSPIIKHPRPYKSDKCIHNTYLPISLDNELIDCNPHEQHMETEPHFHNQVPRRTHNSDYLVSNKYDKNYLLKNQPIKSCFHNSQAKHNNSYNDISSEDSI